MRASLSTLRRWGRPPNPRSGLLRRFSTWLLAGVAITAAAACSLVAGLDKFQFTDAGACAEPCGAGACIQDGCMDAGACQGQPAPDGTGCTTADGGLPGACVAATCVESCVDGGCSGTSPCVTGTCVAATQTCHYASVADGTLPQGVYQAQGDCHTYVCMGGASVWMVDDTDKPDPGNPCVLSMCDDGGPSVLDVAAGTGCGSDGGQTCNDAGACGCTTNTECTTPETCGGGGTPLYCGCTPGTCMQLDRSCGMGDDGCGGELDCDHDAGAWGGTETDTNCGGPLPDAGTCATRCGPGQKCLSGSDCTSTFCTTHVSDTIVSAGGICCDQLCEGACQTCNTAGHCVPVGKNVQNPPLCAGMFACNGSGVTSNACQRKSGASCSLNSNPPCITYCNTGGHCE